MTVIEPDNGFDGSYGAGAGASVWGPESGTIHHVYRDSTTSFGTWRIRYKSSSDSINFTPTPSLDTLLSEASASDNGSSPDLAYHAPEALWYGAINDVSGGDPDHPVRILRATNQDDLFGTWQTIDSISPTVTGEEINILPALARNKSTTLFVDPNGWGYLFFTAGENRPNVDTWYIAQARFRVHSPTLPVLGDTFTNVSPARAQGAGVTNTNTEVGGRLWHAGLEATFATDAMIASQTTTARFNVQPEAGNSSISTQASLDVSGSAWIALGSFDSQSGGFLSSAGEVWMNLKSFGQVVVHADGLNHELFRGPAPGFTSGLNLVELSYNPTNNTLQASVNGSDLFTDLSLDGFGFIPNIQYAGLQFHQPTLGSSLATEISVNGPLPGTP